METYTFKCKNCGATKYKKEGETYTCLYCGYSEEVHFNADGSLNSVTEQKDESNVLVQEPESKSDSEKANIKEPEKKSFLSRLISAIFNSDLVELIIYFLFGYLGIKHFVEGQVVLGIIYIFTFGLFGIGYVIDVISQFIKYISRFINTIVKG